MALISCSESFFNLIRSLAVKNGCPILNTLCDYLNATHPAPADYPHSINYLDISANNPTFISYALTSKAADLAATSDLYNAKKRYHGKPGKTIRKIFADQFSDDDYTRFSEIFFKAQTPDSPNDFTFSIVEGKELLHCYKESNYIAQDDADCNELHNSCMRSDYDNHYMELYASNPKNIKLAVLRTPQNLVAARALVWYGMSINGTPSPVPCFDRIFYTSIATQALMERNLSALDAISIYSSGDKLTISLANYECDAWPYIDSLYYSDRDGNFSNRSNYSECTYRNTDGTRDGDESRYSCAECGDLINEDDCCLTDYNTYCSDCVTYVEGRDEYVLNCNAVYHNGRYYHKDDLDELSTDFYPSGRYVHGDDDTYTVITSGLELILLDDSITTEGGSVWHESETDQYTEAYEHDGYSYTSTNEYYDVDSSDIVTTYDGYTIKASEAFTFEGLHYHEANTVRTEQGDVFPAPLTDYYLIIDGITYSKHLKLEFA